MNKKRNFHSFQLKFCHKNSGFSGDLSDAVAIGSAFYMNKTFSVNPIRTKVGRFRWRLDFLFFLMVSSLSVVASSMYGSRLKEYLSRGR